MSNLDRLRQRYAAGLSDFDPDESRPAACPECGGAITCEEDEGCGMCEACAEHQET